MLKEVISHVKGKHGLEIGGPSSIFRDGPLPIYPHVGSLDGCNFSMETIWEGKINEDLIYRYYPNRSNGKQIICDTTALTPISSETYDFILASHVLEHIANPIKALYEWLRVLKRGGVLLLIVPWNAFTFDHNRSVTTLQHLIDDFEGFVKEDSLAHLQEILSFHDLAMDPPAGSLQMFERRSKDNFQNRCLHHHVFDLSLVREIFKYLELQILKDDIILPYHITVLAGK